jgi:photosystem II stability/assembly factor-like uncharacterized protein
MKHIKIIILFSIIILSTSVNSQWVQQELPGLENINAIAAVSSNTVFAAGSEIYKTENSGTNWVKVFDLKYEEAQYGISFYNQTTGWTCGKGGLVLKTTNGGDNWAEQQAGTENLYSIDFINSTTGYVCGAIGRLYKTTNGGENWTALNPGTSAYLYGVYFQNFDTGWLTGGLAQDGMILKTTNGGTTWTSMISNSFNDFTDIDFINTNTGFVSGYRKVLKTTNAGASWDSMAIHKENPQSMHAVEMVNASTGYLLGEAYYSSTVFKTVDGGVNWYPQWGSGNSTINDISFAPGSYSKAWLGYNGGIRHTTNGGGELIGIEPVSNTIPERFELSQNYPNPFNPVTNINFSVPKAGNVKLIVFDVAGREVGKLVNSQLSAGTYKADFDASHLSSGVYFYKLVTSEFTEVKKMMLVK